jgi:hypothetical protein
MIEFNYIPALLRDEKEEKNVIKEIFTSGPMDYSLQYNLEELPKIYSDEANILLDDAANAVGILENFRRRLLVLETYVVGEKFKGVTSLDSIVSDLRSYFRNKIFSSKIYNINTVSSTEDTVEDIIEWKVLDAFSLPESARILLNSSWQTGSINKEIEQKYNIQVILKESLVLLPKLYKAMIYLSNNEDITNKYKEKALLITRNAWPGLKNYLAIKIEKETRIREWKPPTL